MLLSCSLDGNLRPSVTYFSTLLALAPAQLGPLLARFPPLLVLNIEKNVQPKVAGPRSSAVSLLAPGPPFSSVSFVLSLPPSHIAVLDPIRRR
eukprot:714435-Rhodomonas_salina.1